MNFYNEYFVYLAFVAAGLLVILFSVGLRLKKKMLNNFGDINSPGWIIVPFMIPLVILGTVMLSSGQRNNNIITKPREGRDLEISA